MKKRLYIITLFCFGIAVAQEDNAVPDMVTDRPDATESPLTVHKGYVQIEAGGFYTSFEENAFKTETYAYNTTLIRYGFLDNFEFRLGWNFEETRFSTNGMEATNVLSGFSPLLAGMKVQIADESGWKPQIGLLGHLYLPFTAGSDYRPETTGADFRFSFANTLSDRSSLSYNLGAQWGNDSPEIAYVYTLAYGFAITDQFGIYAELYGDFPEDSRANHL
jgi:hypothetical protein|tara:strand:+ start:113 stop:772 length:660 start_codon:yes stop_codon:yes gene_type:complete